MSLLIESVSKLYGETVAVNDLQLHIPQGEIFGLLGANGAGKTTTIRMVLGLISPTAGKITWKGEQIDYSTSGKVGYLPEERGLYPKLTVKEQLLYFGRLRGMKKQSVLQEMEGWLERFRVPDYKNKKVEELSKGNQQKIQFISSVIHQPELLFLDEPFSGLDPVNVELLKEAVNDLCKKGTTLVFSSHRMEHVEELCQNLCILHKGNPVVHGNLKEIKRSFGKKNILIHTEAELGDLSKMSGVTKVKKMAQGYRVQVTDDQASQGILNYAAAQGFVSHFSLEEPSLNDIFIEKVGSMYE
ncbi:ABC transporter ATP-binding protein [Caldalkalibacillus mannanilyticus]|uniref:ABC transporter ATP-binding protein n=1 Tax=Caldalkalibacillus mannanilyticus TaxID=1418 RepID=UPI0004695B5D|nr:ABC transporter ATP-binding protein [Caldalkalibacillus mannanilyticus]